MSDRTPKLLDTVALLRDLPEHGLARGQVGTIVDETDGKAVLVEFADGDGRTIALPSVARSDLLALSYDLVAAK